jgi:hypothetical protein
VYVCMYVCVIYLMWDASTYIPTIELKPASLH